MICQICKHGQTQARSVSVTLERGSLTLVFKKVPADVCDNCGEQYLSQTTTSQLLKDANEAVEAGVEVEIRSFVAA